MEKWQYKPLIIAAPTFCVSGCAFSMRETLLVQIQEIFLHSLQEGPSFSYNKQKLDGCHRVKD